MSTVDPFRVIFVGENPFIRLCPVDSDDYTTVASLWRAAYSPAGTGHVLFVRSEFTGGVWQMFTDNPPLAQWLKDGIQGMLNPAIKDAEIEGTPARFMTGEVTPQKWTEHVMGDDVEIALHWKTLGAPLLIHTQPGTRPGERPNGMCSVFVPTAEASIQFNGDAAAGSAWPRVREGRPFSTCSLAFAESWTERP